MSSEGFGNTARVLVGFYRGLLQSDPTTLTGVSHTLYVGRQGKQYVATKHIQQKLVFAADSFKSAMENGDAFSAGFLTNKLKDVVLDLLDSQPDLACVEGEIIGRISDLAQELPSPRKWRYLIPIMGVGTPLCVAGNRIREYCPDDTIATQSYEPFASIYQSLRSHFVLEGEVTAADDERASHLALADAEQKLTILRFVAVTVRDETQLPLCPPQVMRHPGEQTSTVLRCDATGEQSYRNCGTLSAPSHLPSIVVGMVEQCRAWDRLNQIMQKQDRDRTKMERQIIVALDWIGQSAVTPSRADEIVCLATAMEAVLLDTDGRETKADNLAERGAWMLRSRGNPQDRRNLSAEIRKIYLARNESIHGGETKIDLELLSRARTLACECVTVLAVDRPFCEMTSPRELGEWVTGRKFGETK